MCVGCEGRVLCQREEADFDRAVLHLLSAYDRGEPVRPLSPMDSHCRFFREIMASAYQAYNQAFVHEGSLRRTAEQFAYMNRQLSGVSALLGVLATLKLSVGSVPSSTRSSGLLAWRSISQRYSKSGVVFVPM